MSLFDFIENIKPEKKQEKQIELTPDDNKYYWNLIEGLVLFPNHIQYFNRKKLIYQNNPFYSIFNETTWAITKKKKWELFITKEFGDATRFNDWCMRNKIHLFEPDNVGLSFYNDPNFPLILLRTKTGIECYAKLNKYNNQLKYICPWQNKNFGTVVDYLRYEANLLSIANISSDAKIVNALKLEVNKGFHLADGKIKLISNNAEEYCLAYIKLNSLRKTNIEAWQMFMDQFSTYDEQRLFMAWVYGIFVGTDDNRQVLWIEGPGFTGKSCVVRTIGNVLASYDAGLYRILVEENRQDQFALSGMDSCRLASVFDNSDNNFFKHKTILNLTGGDHMSIREAYENPKTKPVQVKIIVCSNYPPVIDKYLRHETTRLLHLTMSDANVEKIEKRRSENKKPFEGRLKQQFWGFLAHCKDHYRDLRQSNGLLQIRGNNAQNNHIQAE